LKLLNIWYRITLKLGLTVMAIFDRHKKHPFGR